MSCSLPAKIDRRQEWIDAIETNQSIDHSVRQFDMCELHFLPAYINRGKKRDQLKKNVTPSIFPIAKYVS